MNGQFQLLKDLYVVNFPSVFSRVLEQLINDHTKGPVIGLIVPNHIQSEAHSALHEDYNIILKSRKCKYHN